VESQWSLSVALSTVSTTYSILRVRLPAARRQAAEPPSQAQAASDCQWQQFHWAVYY